MPRPATQPVTQAALEVGLSDVSPAFARIIAQVEKADALGLADLIGLGYRKALEHLVKDYLLFSKKATAEQIGTMHLDNCIKEYVDDPNVRLYAEQAAWLSSAQTHYTREWRTNDIGDLKVLIRLARYWIAGTMLMAQHSSDIEV